MNILLDAAERGVIPDWLLRLGVRARHWSVLRSVDRRDMGANEAARRSFVASMDASPVALVPEKANEQHYETPPEFFRLFLGKRMKYSGCLFADPAAPAARLDPAELDLAEEAMLRLTVERAGIADGMRVLELGAGWGSLALYMAECFPKARIEAASNAANQVAFVRRRAEEAGLSNLTVNRADMNDFAPQGPYDRIVSVEMFEHMRNWRTLFTRIATALAPDGAFFQHVFCHDRFLYPFDSGEDDWMGRNFFSGGMMPSADLPFRINDALRVEDHWRLDGRHYALTIEAWLKRLDARRSEALAVLAEVAGDGDEERLFQKWRMFLLACAELFAYAQGREWGVAHTLLVPARPA